MLNAHWNNYKDESWCKLSVRYFAMTKISMICSNVNQWENVTIAIRIERIQKNIINTLRNLEIKSIKGWTITIRLKINEYYNNKC